jgi:hypothetical protein
LGNPVIILAASSNNINEIEVIVNSDLSKIYNWSKEWLVDFNPKKTECIIFSTNQAAAEYTRPIIHKHILKGAKYM